MAGLKEIRRRIHSVKSTKQITRAMKLVSAAKLRRAQEAALSGRRFGAELKRVFESLVAQLPEDFDHPLLKVKNPDAPRRILVITGERGLCGAYNSNVIKAVQLQELSDAGSTQMVGVGRRAGSAGRRLGWNFVRTAENLPEDASKWPIEELAEEATAAFLAGECSEVVVYYTKFISALTQTVTRERLLPMNRAGFEGETAESTVPTAQKTDPTPSEILNELLPLFVKAKLREAALESKASEHAARMSAMDSATRNADELIEKLRLFYNRARQSAITRELIDIVGGAEAIK